VKKVDYLIVGAGLAGSCLALQLNKKGKTVMVYDLPDRNTASRVAAGLFNPVTGRRVVKTWKADQIFPYLKTFYQEAEIKISRKFFHELPLFMPFASIQEVNDWTLKSEDPTFSHYLLDIHTTPVFSNQVVNPLGGILLAQCGYIEPVTFLEGVRQWLTEIESFRNESFEDVALETESDQIRYRDVIASALVYCNGTAILKSRFFQNLPLRLLKGESLRITTQTSLDRIYNRGIYAIPAGGEVRVGATYNLEDTREEVTDVAREELVMKLRDLLATPFEVTHQSWGIRPTTVDRRPLIGEHPSHKNILIFNGLGTKGVSLAPYFSEILAAYLIGEGELEKESNIRRVKSLYSGS
jgi:glycine oxidase